MPNPAPWPVGRYRLTEKAYMGLVPGQEHQPVAADTEVVWDGRPGPHMVPLDDAAREAVARAAAEPQGLGTLDPTSRLDLTVGADQIGEQHNAIVDALMARLREAEATIARMTGAVAAPISSLASPAPEPAPVAPPPPPAAVTAVAPPPPPPRVG